MEILPSGHDKIFKNMLSKESFDVLFSEYIKDTNDKPSDIFEHAKAPSINIQQ